jgi:hypothetical protein
VKDFFVKIWSFYVENHHNSHRLYSKLFHYSHDNIILDHGNFIIWNLKKLNYFLNKIIIICLCQCGNWSRLWYLIVSSMCTHILFLLVVGLSPVRTIMFAPQIARYKIITQMGRMFLDKKPINGPCQGTIVGPSFIGWGRRESALGYSHRPLMAVLLTIHTFYANDCRILVDL